jgi:transcriptional adapter 2-beta
MSKAATKLANFTALNTNLNFNRCTYCQSGLDSVSIRCNECDHFLLCLKCFSMSAEIGEHKKDHNYTIKSAASFPLFDSESFWTFKEELALLQFIEQYGFGNWDDIAKNLPNRTSKGKY